jgi:hypothetical protein
MLQMLGYVLRPNQMAATENSRHQLISLAAIASAKTVLVIWHWMLVLLSVGKNEE